MKNKSKAIKAPIQAKLEKYGRFFSPKKLQILINCTAAQVVYKATSSIVLMN